MAATPTPRAKAEFGRSIVQFLQDGADGAFGNLRGRSFEQLGILCRRHFDGVRPQHLFGGIDWRVVHELFTFIWSQATQNGRGHWAKLGEELYGLMEYLHDGPPEPARYRNAPEDRQLL